MSYATYQSRSPQRQLPLFQAPGRIFGMSQADRQRVALANAQQNRQTLLSTYATHCTALGRANALPLAYRADAKSRAFKYINLVRASLRANAAAIAKLQADLLTLATSQRVA